MEILTRFGIDKSRFTILAMILILFLGATSYLGLPKREDPEITIRTAAVIVNNMGMSQERLEELIAVPVERKIREIGEVEDIETIITYGQVKLNVNLFNSIPGDQVEGPWEDLRNKMQDIAGTLPDGTQGPFVNTDQGDVSIATVAVTGDGFSMAELEDAADDLRKQIYQVEGIAKVSLFGVQEERIWIEVDARRLATIGVRLRDILEDLRDQNVIRPAGEIEMDGLKVALEANGDLQSVEQIKGVLTRVEGMSSSVRLADLVEIRRGYVEPAEQPVFFDGEPAIVLAVEMASGTDIQVLGQQLMKRIRDYEALQPIGISYKIATFQETEVTRAINNALSNVAQTFVVVFVVMLVFLGMRAATIVTCIVPFTICVALLGMSWMGIDIEQVSIAAVIISLGLLVDNGLVVVEDIQGRVDAGADVVDAARGSGKQFAVPLGVASITTVSAFLPMLLLEGTEGEYAFALGAVVAAMLIGSWLTAMYILPFLCVVLLKPRSKAGDRKDTHQDNAFGGVIRRILPFGIPAMALVVGLILISGQLFGKIKNEMFPYSERSDFLVYMDLPKGANISNTQDLTLRVQSWLGDSAVNPGVVNSIAYIGAGGPRFNLGLSPADADPASSFLMVNTVDLAAAIETADRAREAFAELFPEARFRVTRLPQGGSENGIVEVKITGPDGDVMRSAAEQIQQAFARLPNVVMNESDWGNKVPRLIVEIAQDKARELGVTSSHISDVLEGYFSGTEYSTYREGDSQIPIVLRSTADSRDAADDLANLSMAIGDRVISLDQVAEIRLTWVSSEIRRENQTRQLKVSGKSGDLSAAETLARIQPVLDGLQLGPDYQVELDGELASSGDVNSKLGSKLPIALGVMIAALIFQFNSFRRALATLLTIPLIIVGAPYLLLLLGHPLSFFGMLGLMSLMGIIINNAIVLINQVDLEMKEGGLKLADAIVAASQKRVTPIMLTSITTVCGLLPMAISGGALFEPMAAIMIGGLLFASPLTLFVVPPVLYLLLMDHSLANYREILATVKRKLAPKPKPKGKSKAQAKS
ncbi:MAG: efflux RND transporter permease subunit VmeI [Alphaproteobacteria bacterium]